MSVVRVAAVQTAVEVDFDVALRHAGTLLAEAAAGGAQLAVLPERFAQWAPDSTIPEMAQTLAGPFADWLADQARTHGLYLVGGSMLERAPGNLRPYNTSTVFGPDGALLGRYRKMHLFDALVDGVRHGESDTIQPGEEAVCVSTPLGAIGLTVCYDLRFPELFRALADAGMTIAVLPSGFTRVTGQAHWEVLVRARAIENQAFVIAASMCGYAGPTRDFFGHTMIVDPWGVVLASRATDEGVVLADLDMDALAGVRRRLPALANRRLGAARATVPA